MRKINLFSIKCGMEGLKPHLCYATEKVYEFIKEIELYRKERKRIREILTEAINYYTENSKLTAKSFTEIQTIIQTLEE